MILIFFERSRYLEPRTNFEGVLKINFVTGDEVQVAQGNPWVKRLLTLALVLGLCATAIVVAVKAEKELSSRRPPWYAHFAARPDDEHPGSPWDVKLLTRAEILDLLDWIDAPTTPAEVAQLIGPNMTNTSFYEFGRAWKLSPVYLPVYVRLWYYSNMILILINTVSKKAVNDCLIFFDRYLCYNQLLIIYILNHY